MSLHDLILGIQDSFDKLVVENQQLREKVSKISDSQEMQEEYRVQKKQTQKMQVKLKELQTDLQSLLKKLDDLLTDKNMVDIVEPELDQLDEFKQKENFYTKESSIQFSDMQEEFHAVDAKKEEKIGEPTADMDLLEEIVRDIEGY